MKTYFFHIEIQKEDDGRWSVWVPSLPGCNAWGYSREEALKAIQDAIQIYIEDMAEAGEIPPVMKEGVEIIDAPVAVATI